MAIKYNCGDNEINEIIAEYKTDTSVGYCPKCGDRLSFTEDGQPVVQPAGKAFDAIQGIIKQVQAGKTVTVEPDFDEPYTLIIGNMHTHCSLVGDTPERILELSTQSLINDLTGGPGPSMAHTPPAEDQTHSHVDKEYISSSKGAVTAIKAELRRLILKGDKVLEEHPEDTALGIAVFSLKEQWISLYGDEPLGP